MSKGKRPKPGLPSRKQIVEFIETSDQPAGKREIARHFGLKGQEKIALKALLKDMADEGLIDVGRARAFHKMGGIPKVTVLRVVEGDGDNVYAVPDRWEADAPAPRLRVVERGRGSALGPGDRILARTEEAGNGWRAYPMKKLQRATDLLLGVVTRDENDRFWLSPVDKKIRNATPISDMGDAGEGDLVLCERTGSPRRPAARVTDVLGDPFAPRSFSLIAISKYGIPSVFPDAALAEAEAAAGLPLTTANRRDLRHLPIVAIDPVDARDHDDALWAEPDNDPKNPNGYRLIVAIADVSYYVRPGGALDKEARKRGNSVYFPDRVVPMLPHSLSSDMCSLKAGEDRAALTAELIVNAEGKVTSWRFDRSLVRLAANIAYEDAQAMIDTGSSVPLRGGVGGGAAPLQTDNSRDSDSSAPSSDPTPNPSGEREGLLLPALRTLWDCWALLAKARASRAPLELDLPERQIRLDDDGRIASVEQRQRLDAHRLVEDCTIAANVAAAKALEAKKAPTVYRVHDVPAREKLVALKDYLDGLDISFALGQVVRPKLFNALIDKVSDETLRQLVTEQVLRSQTQAIYTPRNSGHFGLALGSYAHFTSPIRRYADLLVHRALVDAYQLSDDVKTPRDIPARQGLAESDAANLSPISETISRTERRAMEAERETVDRYVAAYLSGKVGETMRVRITGVQRFGFFVTVDPFGGDGLVPVSTLGSERYNYDEDAQTLEGEESGTVYAVGQRLSLVLAEADPISGALKFEPLAEDKTAGSSPRLPKPGSRRRQAGGARSVPKRPTRRRGKR